MVKEHIQNAVASIEESYENNVTDEFIHPIVMTDSNDKPLANEKRMMLLFSSISERTGKRELTEVCQMDFHEQNMHKLNLYYVTLLIMMETY
jgi:2,3-bisphosphoglycerate-independent phosphoglycerate mutase